jgi:hypothetical protein
MKHLQRRKMGSSKIVSLQRQWEENHVSLTHLQGEVVAAYENMLKNLEKNFATLSIMGWWLCTKA